MCLSKQKQQVFNSIFNEVINDVGMPDLIVHLVCNSELSINRIQARGRNEEKSLDTGFIDNLNMSIHGLLSEFETCKIVTINSKDLCYTDESSSIKYIVDKLYAYI